MATQTGEATPRREEAFTWQEGVLLAGLEVLLGRRRDVPEGVGQSLTDPRPEVLRAGADRMARSALAWLCTEGGQRERLVVRSGERVRVRPWTEGEGVSLRFAAASRSLWVDGVRVLSALRGGEAEARGLGDLWGRWLQGVPHDTGDWLVAWQAAASLGAWRLPEGGRLWALTRLRGVSPWVRLAFPGGRSEPGVLQKSLKALVRPGTPQRVVELVEDRLAAAWSTQFRALWQRRDPIEARIEDWSGLGATLTAWLELLDGAERLDLARPVATAVGSACRGIFAEGGEAVRQSLDRAGVRSVVERDALREAVRAAVWPGVWLVRRRDALLAEGYGSERYAEAQVLAADIDRTLGPLRGRLEGIGLALSNTVG